MIPLKDTVTVTRSSGQLDDWGQPIPGETISYKCRIDEGTRLTTSKSGGLSSNFEVVSDTQIMLKGAVAIGYDDELTWTDSTGIVRTRKPLSVIVIKDFSSKPLFTEVAL